MLTTTSWPSLSSPSIEFLNVPSVMPRRTLDRLQLLVRRRATRGRGSRRIAAARTASRSSSRRSSRALPASTLPAMPRLGSRAALVLRCRRVRRPRLPRPSTPGTPPPRLPPGRRRRRRRRPRRALSSAPRSARALRASCWPCALPSACARSSGVMFGSNPRRRRPPRPPPRLPPAIAAAARFGRLRRPPPPLRAWLPCRRWARCVAACPALRRRRWSAAGGAGRRCAGAGAGALPWPPCVRHGRRCRVRPPAESPRRRAALRFRRHG